MDILVDTTGETTKDLFGGIVWKFGFGSGSVALFVGFIDSLVSFPDTPWAEDGLAYISGFSSLYACCCLVKTNIQCANTSPDVHGRMNRAKIHTLTAKFRKLIL